MIHNVNKESDWRDFLNKFQEVGKYISNDYFFVHPAVRGEIVSLYRERVYCYELYHQLRHLLGDRSHYILMGEVDKRKFPAFSDFSVIPDFIVHVPGIIEDNLVVIEVKTVDNLDRVAGDLNKLVEFKQTMQYYQAIILIFGKLTEQETSNTRQKVQKVNLQTQANIRIAWHSRPLEYILVDPLSTHDGI